MEDVFKIFTAWEELYKARKAKGLDKWERLQHLAEKLAGKHSKHITFSCIHPKHEGSVEKHNLGSTEGNLHFLLGYVNPGFHLAPYHWQIIYPDLSDDEVEKFQVTMGHPSKPEFWIKSNEYIIPEGDLDEGQPHPGADSAIKEHESKKRRMNAKSKYGSYSVDPQTGIIYGKDRKYKWELVEDSYFAAQNEDIEAEVNTSKNNKVKKAYSLPEMINHLRQVGQFEEDVYPLVKSIFPSPGSVIQMNGNSESVYGIIRKASIDFYDEVGNPVAFPVYDESYSSFDLTKDGNTHPSIIFSFAKSYLGVDAQYYEQFITGTQETELMKGLPTKVVGNPSPGFDDVPSENVPDLCKSIIHLDDNTYRLVVE